MVDLNEFGRKCRRPTRTHTPFTPDLSEEIRGANGLLNILHRTHMLNFKRTYVLSFKGGGFEGKAPTFG